MAHPDCPIGVDDQSNLELARGKFQPREFDFPPLDHLTLGEKHDWIDFEGGARTDRQRFLFSEGRFGVARSRAAAVCGEGIGQSRIFADHHSGPCAGLDPGRDWVHARGPETQIYSIEQMNLSLIGTAEITLGGLYSGKTLADTDLPIKLCGISHCYRTEAGAAGRASRGLYRVHQFTKIEMFAFTLPDQSDATAR